MATIIEIQDSKMQHLTDYAEKVLKYSGKLMQCLEELENDSKSKYNEYYGPDYRNDLNYKGRESKRYDRERYDDDRYPNRYY